MGMIRFGARFLSSPFGVFGPVSIVLHYFLIFKGQDVGGETSGHGLSPG
jgi:hypothetical protein